MGLDQEIGIMGIFKKHRKKIKALEEKVSAQDKEIEEIWHLLRQLQGRMNSFINNHPLNHRREKDEVKK